MPHLSLEFSQEIARDHDISALCDHLFTALAETGVFGVSDIKVRAKPVEFYRSGAEPQSFVHATLMLMEGRDTATRAGLNRQVLELLSAELPQVGSISVQDVELPRSSYVKRML